jgi:hypothetical protein
MSGYTSIGAVRNIRNPTSTATIAPAMTNSLFFDENSIIFDHIDFSP